MEFLISVIIPVCNGERFIEKALISAINKPEVKEVIVVNDGSTDNTLSIVEKLLSENSKIKVYHHKNNENKGRSASRNLGIKKASSKYLAFLDADDFYLKDRFLNDKKMFESNLDVEGVYNAVGFHFYRDVSVEEQKTRKLNTVNQNIKSENLFEALMSGKYGYFHINGLTVKKEVFDKAGFFDDNLQVGEDTVMFWKMALKCQLVTGVIVKALAIRGVHDSNVFNRKDLYNIYQLKMYESLFFWTGKNKIESAYVDLILNRIWLIKYKKNEGLVKATQYWFYLFLNNIKYLFSSLSIKYFPIIRLRQKLFPFLYNKNRL